jgi:hypothetical protein
VHHARAKQRCADFNQPLFVKHAAPAGAGIIAMPGMNDVTMAIGVEDMRQGALLDIADAGDAVSLLPAGSCRLLVVLDEGIAFGDDIEVVTEFDVSVCKADVAAAAAVSATFWYPEAGIGM